MKALWIMVNYNSFSETVALCKNLSQLSRNGDLSILVVDNSETKNDWTSLTSNPQVSVHEPGKNLGYFNGASYGLAEYLKHQAQPDFVIVSNSDLFVDNYFLDILITLDCKNVGVIGPKIWLASKGESSNPQYISRPSAKKMRQISRLFSNIITLNAVFACYYILRTIKRLRIPKVMQEDKEVKVYSVHGSCMVFTKEYFDKGGNLDHPCFLFGEEIIVAEQCRSLGLDIRYVPSLKVTHDEHRTTGFFRKGTMARYQAESARAVYDLYFSQKPE